MHVCVLKVLINLLGILFLQIYVDMIVDVTSIQRLPHWWDLTGFCLTCVPLDMLTEYVLIYAIPYQLHEFLGWCNPYVHQSGCS